MTLTKPIRLKAAHRLGAVFIGGPIPRFANDTGLGSHAVTAVSVRSSGVAIEGIEFRLHDTVLYNSIYRADDQVLANTHIYGFGASQAPVFHLRRVAGGTMVSTYIDSFDRVWDGATPLE